MKHEEALSRRFLDYIAGRHDIRLIGPCVHDATLRAPIFSFVVKGRSSPEVVGLLDQQQVAVRHGDFYARRAVDALGVSPSGGVVRVSMMHYNTTRDVDRLISALDRL